MSIPTNWRDKRTFTTPMFNNPYASFSTDSKRNMKTTFAEEMLLNNFHVSPDTLRKNLADTIITPEKVAPKNYKMRLEKEDTKVEKDSHMHEDFSPLWGLANFVSGVVNVISNAMFNKRRPVDISSNSGSESALPSMWHTAKLSDENKTLQNENFGDNISSDFLASEMSDCRSAATHCQSKLDQIRLLLSVEKPKQPLRVRRQPKKVFVEANSVEDRFEDAFSPEDFENLADNSCVEYYSPICHHEPAFHEIESPMVKIDAAVSPKQVPETPEVIVKPSEVDMSEMITKTHSVWNNLPDVTCGIVNTNKPCKMVTQGPLVDKTTEILQNVPDLNSTKCKLENDVNKNVLVESCEDKMTKLKLLLQESKKVKAVNLSPNIASDTCSSMSLLDPETQLVKLPPRPKPSTKVKDKRFKNPNRCSDKRRKTKMRQCIEEDVRFADEISSGDVSSSIENSPSTCFLENFMKSLPKCVQNTEMKKTEPKPVPKKDSFDEVAGCFNSSSVESDDSFQIVFHDGPRASQASDCESDDFDIIFEDSPDSCYTSNDVFGDSDDSSDSDEYDSDSDMSDSGCGTFKLSASLSKSVSNLADDSLYMDPSGDEVDCANVQDLTICDSVPEIELEDASDLHESMGAMLTEKKKLLRRNLPVKRVRFSSNPPEVHVMRVWLYAAKQTRVRYWQQFAVDRERFKRRIADIDMAVSWVLKPQHRSRVMFQRFMPWWNAQKRKEIADKKEKEAQEKLKEEERLKNEEVERQKLEVTETDENVCKENTEKPIPEAEEEKTNGHHHHHQPISVHCWT